MADYAAGGVAAGYDESAYFGLVEDLVGGSGQGFAEGGDQGVGWLVDEGACVDDDARCAGGEACYRGLWCAGRVVEVERGPAGSDGVFDLFACAT